MIKIVQIATAKTNKINHKCFNVLNKNRIRQQINFHNKTIFSERGKRLQLQRKAAKTPRENQLITKEILKETIKSKKERILKNIEDIEHDLSEQRVASAFQRIRYLCKPKKDYQLPTRTTMQQIADDFGEYYNDLYK